MIDLREQATADQYDALTVVAAMVPPNGWAVWAFYDAPAVLREMCNHNGGDEDWICVTRGEEEPNWCRWVEKTDSCDEPDFYLLPNGLCCYVGSHS